MSDILKHECGVVMIRLLKPLEYYKEKYGTEDFGLNKLCILLTKQINRGQDGTGVTCLKLDNPLGHRYAHRTRSVKNNSLEEVLAKINAEQSIHTNPYHKPYTGELYLGHLRYGTFGGASIENIQPLQRLNNWRSRSLMLAGNFNMTNIDEMFQRLVNLGQHPLLYADTVTCLEKLGHFLDEEVEEIYNFQKKKGLSKKEATQYIEHSIDLSSLLRRASENWDGGYVMCGMLGHGDSFVMRDPWGIRPAFFYESDEICVVASERPAIQTALGVKQTDIREVSPGSAIIIKRNGTISESQIREKQTVRPCSFERIYFSSGNDGTIYKERKKLGRYTVPSILKAIDGDLKNTVFSFIPNTAEVAFYGIMEEIKKQVNRQKIEKLLASPKLTNEEQEEIVSFEPRFERLAIKDVKMRTFIANDNTRDDMVSHVYNVTYGIVERGKDNLVVIDDSIVRGTTLKVSILKILDSLSPRKIVIVSSAPQIRYPDCYGIDMSNFSKLVAFEAAIALLKERGLTHVIDETYKQCKAQENLPKEEVYNHVKSIYAPFSEEEISEKITTLLTPVNCQAEVQIIFQTVENLHKAIPEHQGDWYFTGNYPTPGGNKVANTSFINYCEGKNGRPY